jgi:IclR family KDG regulon transcriptional repressor
MDDDLNDARQPESVAAVLKVFAILQSLADRSETGVSELSMRLAMPKATVYRFLQTMRSLGYVRQEADSERYGLTMKVFELGTKALTALAKALGVSTDWLLTGAGDGPSQAA